MCHVARRELAWKTSPVTSIIFLCITSTHGPNFIYIVNTSLHFSVFPCFAGGFANFRIVFFNKYSLSLWGFFPSIIKSFEIINKPVMQFARNKTVKPHLLPCLASASISNPGPSTALRTHYYSCPIFVILITLHLASALVK